MQVSLNASCFFSLNEVRTHFFHLIFPFIFRSKSVLIAIKEVLRGQELPPGIARFIAEPFNVVTL